MKAGEQRAGLSWRSIRWARSRPCSRRRLITEQVRDLHLPRRSLPRGGPGAGHRRSAARPLSALAGYTDPVRAGVRRQGDEARAGQPPMNPYGDFDTMIKTVLDQLRKGPTFWVIASRRPTCCGAARSTGLRMFGIVEKTPAIAAYVERVTSRPAFQTVGEAGWRHSMAEHAARQAGGQRGLIRPAARACQSGGGDLSSPATQEHLGRATPWR